ncbi:hypothetical protein O3G_MSEX012476 [Manduca sexta]|uniref:Peptidase S1 domain-containing protein n=1 Tax=Manduca sexta TaxID=7130 RepID=A0A921ZP14_MANSE|nr:hypothetical protein O3G_MSEX012476 [Manduca sexta]KAG6461205.1 hypothetical protein O3G_MSEX012476 [Manduca sexta]
MVTLKRYRKRVCKNLFSSATQITHYFDEKTQLCFDGYNKTNAGDTCNGDSGAPLCIKHEKIKCMYLVVGIVSGGIGCAWRNQPAYFTRVSHYIPWIESIVWPNQ